METFSNNTGLSYFPKMNDNIVNMMTMLFVTTVMSSLTTILSEFVKSIFTIISTICIKLWKQIKYYIPYFRKYTVNIIYDKHDTQPGENNRLLVNAILYDFHGGDYYKITNKEVSKCNHSDFARESGRAIVLSVLEEFIEDDITIRYDKIEKKLPEKNKNDTSLDKTTYSIERIFLSSYKSVEHIKAYIEKKRNYYIGKFCSNDDKTYVYTGNFYGEGYVTFQKTNFNSNKTFKTWFCSEKPNILKVVDNFINRKSVYKLPTNVYKLGILLHGKPGCGKTSFIKALAKEMNRSIVTISLDKFDTFTSFMKIFQSQYIMSPAESVYNEWSYLPMNKRILVFEDVDTAGDIVKLRIEEDEKVTETKDDKKDDKKKDDKKTKADAKEKNTLVLGDILNALDGICETTGLVYILTTNHIETLDPALIRPGRINCSIELKEMNKEELKEMLNYYYVENNVYEELISDEQKSQLIHQISLVLGDRCTPSIIENYCNKYDLVTFHEKMGELIT